MSTDLKRKDLLKTLLKTEAGVYLKARMKYGPDLYDMEDEMDQKDSPEWADQPEDEIDRQNKLLSKSLQKRRK